MPVAEAYAALQSEDPPRAAALSPADTTRVARALEVVRSTGRSLEEWQADLVGGIVTTVALHPAVLLPPRAWLYERCDRRFALMLDQGALDEVAALLARRLDPALPVMRAIGVPELRALLAGEISRDVAVSRGAQATRNYAKRQFTWFRNQPPPEWQRIESEHYDPEKIFASLLRN
jgi:tRNA dimethylallyltransferase